MEIRKKFTIGGVSHVVRNCSSDRCKFSLHGHTYDIEVLLESSKLDNGHMVYDFGLFIDSIGAFVKCFENTFVVWHKEDDKFKSQIKKHFERYIEMDTSPSAERLSEMFFCYINGILNVTKFGNNECDVKLSSVKVHETRSGYAEFKRGEEFQINTITNTNIPKLLDILHTKEFVNESPIQQVV